ncbi:fluoride efflux transporter CrcB [Peribacillus sp. B-H-3]|jgi:fluoride exporter|uniref:fluoride efflux transporter CrcB n=1 Tax=Peribacillus sp. B-H-3 TaxID=3400420 RepID=UPI003B028A59
MTLFHLTMVGLGGFFGAISRYSLSKFINAKHSSSIPYGTMAVNLAGAFLLGFITGSQANLTLTLLLGTGFMGAFTTFSTLKLEIIQLHMKKYKKVLILYIVITYGAGILLAYLGYHIGGLLYS